MLLHLLRCRLPRIGRTFEDLRLSFGLLLNLYFLADNHIILRGSNQPVAFLIDSDRDAATSAT